MERIGGLHVALFLVLLSPGYNPPRRRWCLYLSRGKPPSVRVSLPLAFTRPSPSHTLSLFLSFARSLSLSLPIHLLATRSPSEPYTLLPPAPQPAIHPPSQPRHTLRSPPCSPPPRFHPPTPIHLPPSTRFPSSTTRPPPPHSHSTHIHHHRHPPHLCCLHPSFQLTPTHPLLKVGAPYWRLNHPARGHDQGERTAEGRGTGT